MHIIYRGYAKTCISKLLRIQARLRETKYLQLSILTRQARKYPGIYLPLYVSVLLNFKLQNGSQLVVEKFKLLQPSRASHSIHIVSHRML